MSKCVDCIHFGLCGPYIYGGSPFVDSECAEFITIKQNSFYLDMIEELLINNNVDIEDYKDPLRGISQYESIENAIIGIIKERNSQLDAERYNLGH